MKATDLFVQALENEGVEYIFGIPGEENLDFLESLRQSKIQFILTRHEQAAGFMAATYGRLTGKTGVALSTLGPGATNFVTAISHALLGGMPVLFITGQKPIRKSEQGNFQIIDVVHMMHPITKFTKQIKDANNIPHMVRDAFRIASFEKPGPVHLELPEDVASEEVQRHPFEVTKYDPPAADQKTIRQAADIIMKAKKPLLLIASAANRPQNQQPLQELVDKTGLYFFNTQMGKGVVDERHSNFLGTAALSSNDYIHLAIEHADLIVNIGHDVTEKPPFLMKENGVQVIHLSSHQAHIDDVYFPQHEVIGCLWTNLKALIHAIEPSKNWELDYYKRIKVEIEKKIFIKCDDKSFPLVPQRLVSDVREAMPDDGIISLDNGMYKIWFARNYLAHKSNTILLDNALATMGAGLPVAIGAKIVYPKRKVAAICGDGGFMMNSQELETAVRHKLDLTVIIIKDNGYGMIKWKQEGMHFPEFGLDFGNPDFVKYAESYGAKGFRITEGAGQLSSVLKNCLETPGVNVIEVPVDYSESEKVFFEELKNKTALVCE